MQNHAQAIDLGFDNEPGFFDAVVNLADALIPGPGIPGAKGIGQAEDGMRMADLLELFRRERPGTLGG